MEELFTLNDLARQLKKCRQTLWRWRRAGDFPAPIMVGGSPMWTRAAIEAWLKSREVGA